MKIRYLIIGSLLFILAACSGMDKQAEMARNKKAVEELVLGFNAGDWSAIDKYVADDFVGHNPLSPEDIMGKEGLQGTFEFSSGSQGSADV